MKDYQQNVDNRLQTHKEDGDDVRWSDSDDDEFGTKL